MFNPEFKIFDDNMFIQLRGALAELSSPDGLREINLTIGEPQMPAPDLLVETVASHADKWANYPKADGDAGFRDDIICYLENRYGNMVAAQVSPDHHIVPVVGTREPLHMLGQMVRGAKKDAVALMPNPFYHAWRAGALGTGGEIVVMNCTAETGYLPDLDKLDDALLQRTVIFYMCSPTNPHGYYADKAYLKRLLELARHYNFLLLSDECYADIWRDVPPVSALEAAAEMGDGLSHLVVLNSLSKRSNAAGLRAGFLAGDERAISLYKKLVGNGAALVPTPLLKAAGALYRDESHAQAIRQHYQTSFDIVKDKLGVSVPKGGFFIWLKVKDDLAFAKRAYAEQALRLMPGRFMALTTDQGNPGQGFVRVALVHDHDTIREAADRLAILLATEEQG